MPSQVDVVNYALDRLGELRIQSLDDDEKAARLASATWAMHLRNELSRAPWSFATTRASIPALADGPAWGYSYAYQLPDDCVQLLEVADSYGNAYLADLLTEPNAPFAVEGRAIATDLSAPLAIKYTRLVEDPEAWSPRFVSVFALRLAMEWAPSIARDEALSNRLEALYDREFVRGVRSDAIQQPPQGLMDGSWLQGRFA